MRLTRTELCRRLHDMVDQLGELPYDWFDDGVYPMIRVVVVEPETGERIVLVVGIDADIEQPSSGSYDENEKLQKAIHRVATTK